MNNITTDILVPTTVTFSGGRHDLQSHDTVQFYAASELPTGRIKEDGLLNPLYDFTRLTTVTGSVRQLTLFETVRSNVLQRQIATALRAVYQSLALRFTKTFPQWVSVW